MALLAWATSTGVRSRERPSARSFTALLATLTLWALLAFGSTLLPTVDGSLASTVLELGQLGCAVVVPGVWTIYVLGYTGRGTGLTWRRIALLFGIALPVLLGGLVMAAGLPTPVVERLFISLFATEAMYLTGLFLYATYLLFDLSRRHTRVSKRQVAIVTFGVLAPYVLSGVGNGSPVIDGGTLSFLVAGGLLAFSVKQYPVLTGFPTTDHVARERVVEALQEAVVVLDWENYVLDANETTVRLFDCSPPAIIGEPVGAAIDGLERADLSAGATGRVTLQTTKGRRQFEFSVSAVDDEVSDDDEESGHIARILLLRDVTDRQTREQRLTVLNRVLRHNVRNKLDVVLANADHVRDDELQEGIRRSARDLVALSQKARKAEDVMTASTESPVPVDVTDVASAVAEQYRTADRTADITVTGPDELVISSHRTIVRQVLSELVDNALTHSDESSQVDIRVRAGEEESAELVVADDGPGIPARERQILADGVETQLEHGQGIGLWFVNWAVHQLGGDLEIAENQPTGSVVTVRFYDAAYSS
ncbi:ATP-binding protein [Halomicrococcus gelatinilyticus]|uniref:ATP-binding protein n=1 Tax=Halomicrococcus gelatinilyticus TaxID=1702103 RepID=UPI002E158608